MIKLNYFLCIKLIPIITFFFQYHFSLLVYDITIDITILKEFYFLIFLLISERPTTETI